MKRINAFSPTSVRWWSQRSARERQLLALAIVLIVSGLVLAVGIAPAFRTVREYPAKRSILDAQLQLMQALQARAQRLRGQSTLDVTAAQGAFQVSITNLGANASMWIAGNQASVSLRGIEAAKLAQWLALVRTEARMVPVEAKLTREGSVWSGTLLFNLPTS